MREREPLLSLSSDEGEGASSFPRGERASSSLLSLSSDGGERDLFFPSPRLGERAG